VVQSRFAVLHANQFRRDPALGLAFSRIYSPELLCAGNHARFYRQTAPAMRCQLSALWENYLERFKDELHPRIFLDWKQSNNFRASSNNDCNGSSSGGIHA